MEHAQITWHVAVYMERDIVDFGASNVPTGGG